MKGFLITPKGMEDIAAVEVKELIGSNSKTLGKQSFPVYQKSKGFLSINETCIIFDIKTYEDLFKLCYKSQSAIGIFYLLNEFNYKKIFTDFENNLEKIKLNEWLSKNTQFRVKCIKNHNNLPSSEIEEKIGEIIINHIQEKYNYKQKVSLENPEIVVFVYLLQNKCYVGIDFAGFDLSKRSYKVLAHFSDIKGTIAYALVRLSEYNKSDTLLDTLSGSGTIPIEAALYASKFPVNFFNKEKFIFLKFNKFKNYNFDKLFKKIDKVSDYKIKIHNIDSSMNYINYAKKNSKIAGVDKKICFSRTGIEWLDTKFDKGSIDKIITKLPSLKGKDADKIYNEFFYQVEYILNKKGKIVLIGDKELIGKYSSRYMFKISLQKVIYTGEMKYSVFVMTR